MEDKKTYDINDLIIDACDELDDLMNWYKKDDVYYVIDDVISEIADSNIPIYNYDLLQYAIHDSDLREPNEFAGENPSVEQIIIGNIFERLLEGLYKHSEDKGYE